MKQKTIFVESLNLEEKDLKERPLEQNPMRTDRPIIAFAIGAFTVVLIFFMLFSVLSSLETEFRTTEIILHQELLSQFIFSLMVFVLPAFVLSRSFIPNDPDFLQYKKKPNFKTIAILIVAFFSTNFFLNWLVNLNEMIPMSSQLRAIFDKMQAQLELMQEAYLQVSSVGSFLLVFILVAILPAVSEEFFFRGLLQGSLKKAGIGKHHTIVIAAILFALIHVQFYNFLALFFMGALLGYAYHYTKNIWVPIIVHLFNNGLIVILTYANTLGWTSIDLEAEPPFLVSLAALVVFIGFIYMFVKHTRSMQIENQE